MRTGKCDRRNEFELLFKGAHLFARLDYVEEAWRIVDLVLNAGGPIYECEKSAAGPREVQYTVSPTGGCQPLAWPGE